jgi:hypothetical protein
MNKNQTNHPFLSLFEKEKREKRGVGITTKQEVLS